MSMLSLSTLRHDQSAPGPGSTARRALSRISRPYSLGVIAYEMLAGFRPFPGPGLEDYRDQHLHNDPPPLEGVPALLAALVEECLYKAPGARPTPSEPGSTSDCCWVGAWVRRPGPGCRRRTERRLRDGRRVLGRNRSPDQLRKCAASWPSLQAKP